MSRRLLVESGGGLAIPWSTGGARYRISEKSHDGTLVVAVDCRIDAAGDVTALLDTGAEWSVLGGVLATSLLGSSSRPHDYPMIMRTRLGPIEGWRRRVPVTLLANDGRELEIAATVLLAPEWEGPPVLGYRGLLERIRFALDPGVTDADQWMYFGAVG